MKRYETVVVFDPTLDEERVSSKVQDLEARIRDGGGEVQQVHRWGKRKLAYSMGRKENGVYVVVEFRAPGERLAEIERGLRLDEQVLRHMTVVGPDEALLQRAAQAAERAAQRRVRAATDED